MFWHLRKYEDSPLFKLSAMKQAREDGTLVLGKDQKSVDLANEIRALVQAQGRNLYIPNLKEQRWILQPHRVKGISGGNRSGKTATCTVDIIAQCEGWHPLQKPNLERLIEEALEEWVRDHCRYIYENKLWIKSPPVMARVVTVDFPNYVEKIIGPEYEKWATLGEVKAFQYENDKKRRVEWKNKSRCEFMTYEQPVKAHGGSARDVINFDEEPTQEHYEENKMRIISTKGRVTCGMTSVNGVTWTEEAIWEPGLSGDPKIYAIEMSTYDNPINTDEIVDEIKEMCADETEVAIRIYGKRTARGGRVFKMQRDEHPWFIEPFSIPHEGGMLISSIDPHPHIPHAVVWIWVDFDGKYHPLIDGKPNLYQVAELYEGGSIPHLANAYHEIESRLGRPYDIALCDPMAWIDDQTKDTSKPIEQQLSDNDIFVMKGSKDLKGGLLKVQEMLSLNWTEKLGDGNWDRIERNRDFPQLMTFDNLTRTRWEYKNYRYPNPDAKRLKDPRQAKPRPIDKDDHMMEAMRRICEFIYDEQYESVMPEESKRNLFAEQGIMVEFDDPELTDIPIHDANLG